MTPDSVWYARVLLLFSASAATDTGSKSFDCALVSTLESYDDSENGYHNNNAYYILNALIHIMTIKDIKTIFD